MMNTITYMPLIATLATGAPAKADKPSDVDLESIADTAGQGFSCESRTLEDLYQLFDNRCAIDALKANGKTTQAIARTLKFYPGDRNKRDISGDYTVGGAAKGTYKATLHNDKAGMLTVDVNDTELEMKVGDSVETVTDVELEYKWLGSKYQLTTATFKRADGSVLWKYGRDINPAFKGHAEPWAEKLTDNVYGIIIKSVDQMYQYCVVMLPQAMDDTLKTSSQYKPKKVNVCAHQKKLKKARHKKRRKKKNKVVEPEVTQPTIDPAKRKKTRIVGERTRAHVRIR